MANNWTGGLLTSLHRGAGAIEEDFPFPGSALFVADEFVRPGRNEFVPAPAGFGSFRFGRPGEILGRVERPLEAAKGRAGNVAAASLPGARPQFDPSVRPDCDSVEIAIGATGG
jgi:hypothetical protein